MRLLTALVIATAGCRFGFDPLPIAAVEPDSFDRCAAERVDLGPWSTPTKVSGVNAPLEDDDPEIRFDGLELLWTSNRAGTVGNGDVWRAQRAAAGDPWGPTEHVLELSTVANENTPALSSDGLTVWFGSDRAGTKGGEDIWVSTRPSLSEAWTLPVVVPELASTQIERGPSLYDNDLAMILHSDRGASNDLFVSRRASLTSPWSTPMLLGTPNTAGDELRAWISPCGLDLYFQSSSRAAGDMNFYVARRTSVDEPFGADELVTELNSADYDQDLRLTADRRHAYFSSYRNSGAGELWEATR